MIEERIREVENSKSTRVTDAKGAKVKQWLHDFFGHPWVVCKEAADGADGRAECGKRRTSWGPSRYRYGKSATVTTSPPDVPVSLPSSTFDFVPGTSPSWSLKVKLRLKRFTFRRPDVLYGRGAGCTCT